MGTLESHAVSLEAQKFRAPMQPVCRREAQMRAHWRLARLLGRDRDRKPHAALGAAALENLASTRRGHSCQEPMSSYASSVMRLVGPFHLLGASFTLVLNSGRKGRLVGRVSLVRQETSGCGILDKPRTRNRTIPHAIEQAPAASGREGNFIECETRRGFRTSFGRGDPCTRYQSRNCAQAPFRSGSGGATNNPVPLPTMGRG